MDSYNRTTRQIILWTAFIGQQLLRFVVFCIKWAVMTCAIFALGDLFTGKGITTAMFALSPYENIVCLVVVVAWNIWDIFRQRRAPKIRFKL